MPHCSYHYNLLELSIPVSQKFHYVSVDTNHMTFILLNVKMLAKGIIEKKLLPFLSREVPEYEFDGEPSSVKVM